MSDICTWPSCGHTAKGQCQPDKPVTVPDEAPALYAETIRQRRVIERLNAEVERLRTGHQGACYACEPVGELNIRLKAEVERMRTALEKAVAWADRHHKEPDWLDEARAALAAGLAAWPGAQSAPPDSWTRHKRHAGSIILPLQETPNAK